MELTKFNLINKTILITGASSGIGRQTAIEVANAGANVIITGRNEKQLKKTLSLCKSGNNSFIVSNLLVNNEIIELVSKIDKLDGVVHSAGIVDYMPCKFINEKNIYEIMDINYKAPVLLTSYLLRNKKMNQKASFVFISSISSVYPAFGSALYTSSKSALEGFSRALAIEIAPKKMRSNCLLPTFVETKLVENAKKTVSKESIDKYKNLLPLGFGYPEDVASAAVFLLSDASKWITGDNIKMGSL